MIIYRIFAFFILQGATFQGDRKVKFALDFG